MFDQEDEKIIQQLGILYHINALDMQDLVKQSMIENHLNSRLLAQNCRNYYDLKMPEKFTEVLISNWIMWILQELICIRIQEQQIILLR